MCIASTIRRFGDSAIRVKASQRSRRIRKKQSSGSSGLRTPQQQQQHPELLSLSARFLHPKQSCLDDWHSEYGEAPDQSWLGWLRRSKFFKRCRRVRISKFFAAVNLSLWQQVQHCLLLLHTFFLVFPSETNDQEVLTEYSIQSMWWNQYKSWIIEYLWYFALGRHHQQGRMTRDCQDWQEFVEVKSPHFSVW